jgi:hypothetical protein
MPESATVLSRTARVAVETIDPAIASAETMKEKVAAKNQETVAGYLPGEPPVDFLVLLITLIALLNACKTRIIAGDNAFRVVRAAKNKLGTKLQTLTLRVGSAARQVRTDLRRHYGELVLVDVLMTEAPNRSASSCSSSSSRSKAWGTSMLTPRSST